MEDVTVKFINFDELSKFKKLPGNRPITQNHVERLVASIQQCNDLKVHPIIVDENHFVIDGQHRLKKLKIGLWYIIDHNTSPDKVIHISDCKMS